jgi:tetratricopeptide (TPR) repeat protein
MVWAMHGAYVVWKSQAASDRATAIAEHLEPLDWKGTDAECSRLIEEASDAVDANPSDVKARYSLACYRWHIASSGENDQPQHNPSDDAAPSGPSRADALQVIDDLNAAREICPTFGPAYAVAGQIERLVLNLPVGSAHVHTAYSLAPAHPEVCLAAAQLAAAEGNFDDSLHKAQRCLALDPALLPQIVELYLHGVDRPDLAVAAVGQDRDWLFQLYDDLRDESQQSGRPNVTAAMADAREAIKSSCDRADAPAWTLAALGTLFREERDYPRAVESYRKALQEDYGQTDWRLCLANVLVEAGHNDDAIRQAEICLHLQPRMQGALKLIQDVNTQSSVSQHSSISEGSAQPD